MEEELSINIAIAGRTYPLTIRPEKEYFMRKAAKLVNDRMKMYQANYSVKDQQDLLAMCVLEFASKTLEVDNSKAPDNHEVEEQLHEMEQFLSKYLEKL